MKEQEKTNFDNEKKRTTIFNLEIILRIFLFSFLDARKERKEHALKNKF